MADLTKLGKYEIRRELGRGAMGVVYEGHDPSLNRAVAIKIMTAHNEKSDTDLRRFRREHALPPSCVQICDP